MPIYDEISKASSKDNNADIRARQAIILKQIEIFKRSTGARSLQGYVIRQLQQQYNDLVDQNALQELNTLPDPIENLPPELWQDIIEPLLEGDYPVDVLLELVSVSRRWCTALISLPRLWRKIVLDDRKHDYLAKAVMGLYFSGSCEINVFMYQSKSSWQDVLSLLMPEAKRIRLLYLDTHEKSYAQDILTQLREMPVLKEISMPGLRDVEMSDIQLEALGLKHMPSLQVLLGPSISIDSESWGHLIRFHKISYLGHTKRETLERYGKLPNLWFLAVLGLSNSDPPSTTLNIRLPHVTNFLCRGVDFKLLMSSLGAGLTQLSMDTQGFTSMEELASSLEPFTCLRRLEIDILNSDFTYNGRTPVANLRSIRSLELFLGVYGRENYPGGWTMEENVDSIYEGLISIAPSVEMLTLRGGMLTRTGMRYITGLANLSDLSLAESLFIPSNYPASVNTKSLQNLTIRDLTRSPELLISIAAPDLRELRLSGPVPRLTFISGAFQVSEKLTELPRFIISGETMAGITSLTLPTHKYVRWEFYSLPVLKELELTLHGAPSLMLWASDVLEAILMRPCDLPVLEKIKLTEQFFEWDILLLMLERRIICSHLGISHVKVLIVSHYLPYKLLRPITVLLQGKLPEREANDEFSLTATGQRLWNQEM